MFALIIVTCNMFFYLLDRLFEMCIRVFFPWICLPHTYTPCIFLWMERVRIMNACSFRIAYLNFRNAASIARTQVNRPRRSKQPPLNASHFIASARLTHPHLEKQSPQFQIAYVQHFKALKSKFVRQEGLVWRGF